MFPYKKTELSARLLTMILTLQKARKYATFQPLFIFSCQHYHALHVAGVWEEVHGLNGAYVVVWGEVGEVACEGCRVTADAEDLRDVCVNQGIQ